MVVDIFEGFEAFLVTDDRMLVAEPGSVAFLDVCLKVEERALIMRVVLSLDLHIFGGFISEQINIITIL